MTTTLERPVLLLPQAADRDEADEREADGHAALQTAVPEWTDPIARLVLVEALDRPAGARLAAWLDELVARGVRTVVLDLAAVPAMDAAVARALVRRDWQLTGRGGELRLTRPQPPVRRTLRWHAASHLVRR